jgi:hypothetical protein
VLKPLIIRKQLSIKCLIYRWVDRPRSDSVFLEKLLELSLDELKMMELTLHVRSSDDGDAFELLSLLLTRYRGADGQGEPLELDSVG